MSAASHRAEAAKSQPARTARDFYVQLMRGSQPRPALLAERERWLRSVRVEGREERLFEFELLVRAIERSFQLHNLPLDASSQTVDFTETLKDV